MTTDRDYPTAPREGDAAAHTIADAGPATPAMATTADLLRMPILVLEQTEQAGAPVTPLLHDIGFLNVEYCDSLHDALVVLDRLNFDLIICNLGETASYRQQLLHNLRTDHRWKNIPVMIVADQDEEDFDTLTEARASGTADVLFHPLRRAELMSRVFLALNLKHEHDLADQREMQLENQIRELNSMERQLGYLVWHDELTGLFNRRRLDEEIEAAIRAANQHQHTAALISIDIDQFRLINMAEGYQAGDRLLIEISHEIRKLCQPTDTVCRIGADEFAVLRHDADIQIGQLLAQEIREVIERHQIEFGELPYQCTASLGLTMIEAGESERPEDILNRANQAFRTAKRQGRNAVYLYNPLNSEIDSLRKQAYWANRIRLALTENRFRLMFQPIVPLQGEPGQRYEVLVRMLDGSGQLHSPAEFIKAAEAAGMIHSIDKWVSGKAIDILSEMDPAVRFCVNLSGHAPEDPSLLSHIEGRIQRSGIDPARLTFEITETAPSSDFQQTVTMVKRLKALGCGFALDDFGSGYNTFCYLRELPFNEVKIDGSFIRHLTDKPVDQSLVRAMVDAARALDLKTIAEMVEDEDALSLLKQLGVDYAQGYAVGKPSLSLPGVSLDRFY
ncbi:MAG: EAL domain-containing protein [Gammaproteobacteria bacterium]|jgi:diguanylate cyclase (GGDEF)-like protein